MKKEVVQFLHQLQDQFAKRKPALHKISIEQKYRTNLVLLSQHLS